MPLTITVFLSVFQGARLAASATSRIRVGVLRGKLMTLLAKIFFLVRPGSMIDRVVKILRVGTVRQVLHSVVFRVPIQVSGHLTGWTGAYEGFQDQVVQVAATSDTRGRSNGDVRVTVLCKAGFEYPGLVLDKALHAPGTAYQISPFKARNRAPLSLRHCSPRIGGVFA